MNGIFYCRSEFTRAVGARAAAVRGVHDVPRRDRRRSAGSRSTARDACLLRPGRPGAGSARRGPSSGRRAAGADTPRAVRHAPRAGQRSLRGPPASAAAASATSLICGAVRFDHPAAHHLIRLLPRSDRRRRLELAGDGMDPEHAALHGRRGPRAAPGGETVITRLADILVIQAIRSWIARDPAAQTGWLGALRDRQIGRAIAPSTASPRATGRWRHWRASVGMSRSAFAARFTQLVGEPAMHYVTRWKMHAALMWLKEGDVPRSTSPAGSATSPRRRSAVRSSASSACRPARSAGSARRQQRAIELARGVRKARR